MKNTREIIFRALTIFRDNYTDYQIGLVAESLDEDLEPYFNQLQNTSSNSDYAKCPCCGADKGHIIVQAGCVVCEHEW